MIKTNLILIEGIPGSGKSSMGQQLDLHLNKLGYRSYCFFEQDTNHPIYPESEFTLQYTTEPDWMTREKTRQAAFSRWIKFTSSLAGTDQVMILEGSFFQAPVDFHLLLNRSIDEAVASILQIESVIESLDPVLLYLYQTDVEAALNRILKSRSAGFADYLTSRFQASPYGRAHGVGDYHGVVIAYKEHRRITDVAFSKLQMRKLAIENSTGDWNRYYHSITNFLALPPVRMPPALPSNANLLVGEYQRVNSTDVFTIAADEHGLSIHREMKLRLLWKFMTTFCVAGTRTELKFETDEHGSARAVEVSGREPNFTSVWKRT
jgi:hypothetical protein